MTSNAHCVLLARYNEWMNARLYAVCAGLTQAELKLDRGAFFGSIAGTLEHLVYGDLASLSRFTGDPARPPALGAELYGSFAALRAARTAIDARIVAWASTLSEAWLARTLTYTSQVDGKTRTLPHWALVTHMFNHQTHHRGQLGTLLTQMGLDVGSTDIPFMPQFEQPAPHAA